MGLEFLARIRRTSLVAGAALALLSATYVTLPAGLAAACGVAWSLANLALVQALVVALTGPERRSSPARRRALLALTGGAALFAAGALLLVRLPIPALMLGFCVPFAVMVAKAAALLLMPTRFWRRVSSDPRVAAPLVLAVLAALWLGLPGAQQALARGAHARHAVHGAPHVAAARPSATAGQPAGAVAERAPHAEAHEAATGEHKSEEPPEFPTFITLIERAFPDAAWARALVWFQPLLYSLVIALLLIWAARAATRRPSLVPRGLQNIVELAVEKLNDFIIGILGPEQGPRFVPLLGTLFIYILAMNLIGLVPFMKSPTSSLNVTVALALTVFVYAQWVGIRGLGPWGYLHHMMGSPRDPIGWGLVVLMLPIHVMGELAKPISLSCRLFGNIFGEDMLLVGFATLGISMLSFAHLPFGVPLHAIFFPLALLSSALQAMVFTVLSTIYILLMLPHDHGHDHGHGTGQADEVPDLI
jgi:F-type H+-transporting ATPase subunit a